MQKYKVGALCAGYGGLELGLSQIVNTELLWVSDIDTDKVLKDAPNRILQARFARPNLGDLTKITQPPKVDIVTAGFPCQPVSVAGNRKGVNDERWLINDVCRIAKEAEAKWLILENVQGIFSANKGLALGIVCSAMDHFGFTRWEWNTYRASDIGAPHRRERWFCVATNTNGSGLQRRRSQRKIQEDSRASGFAWGRYARAIRRWEKILGRPAPDPALEYGYLSHHFVEWMMGLPQGHVCGDDISLSRSTALKCLGNGVVPQQAQFAIDNLLDRIGSQSLDTKAKKISLRRDDGLTWHEIADEFGYQDPSGPRKLVQSRMK